MNEERRKKLVMGKKGDGLMTHSILMEDELFPQQLIDVKIKQLLETT